MSATGLEVFDKTLQSTNTWLGEIMEELGPDRQVAWHALGAVLHTLRDMIPLGAAVHLGAQLPLLVRGLYYDQWLSPETPVQIRKRDEFVANVQKRLANIRPVDAVDARGAARPQPSRHARTGGENPHDPARAGARALARAGHAGEALGRLSAGPSRSD